MNDIQLPISCTLHEDDSSIELKDEFANRISIHCSYSVQVYYTTSFHLRLKIATADQLYHTEDLISLVETIKYQDKYRTEPESIEFVYCWDSGDPSFFGYLGGGSQD